MSTSTFELRSVRVTPMQARAAREVPEVAALFERVGATTVWLRPGVSHAAAAARIAEVAARMPGRGHPRASLHGLARRVAAADGASGAIYRGEVVGGFAMVTVERDGQRLPLLHRVRHSPDGLNWGYGGSGPADLARSILWEHLGREPEPALYQDFTWAFVARFPHGQPWILTGREIERWLGARGDR
jgi:hypothetical protein